MKTTALRLAVVLAAAAATAHAAKLDVHEWGTFTIVAGSDGQPLRWYQPASSVTELPRFVTSFPTGGKGLAALNYARMETPVLYFYPDAPTPIRVKVDYADGRFTERFNPAREEKLIALFDQPLTTQPTPAQLETFRALHLGRFANAALQRAHTLLAQRTENRFQLINYEATRPAQTAVLSRPAQLQ